MIGLTKTKKILNEINTDLFNGKDKDKILSELKKIIIICIFTIW